jgi:hypothetical protein
MNERKINIAFLTLGVLVYPIALAGWLIPGLYLDIYDLKGLIYPSLILG